MRGQRRRYRREEREPETGELVEVEEGEYNRYYYLNDILKAVETTNEEIFNIKTVLEEILVKIEAIEKKLNPEVKTT